MCPHEAWIDDPECDCGGCGPTWYAQVDYLLWYASGMQLPPLVTLNDNGAPNLTETDTRILFGGSDVLTEERSGGRIRIGTWLDCCNRCGLEAEYFGLENDSIAYFADSGTAGMAQLGRPFLDVNPRDMANNHIAGGTSRTVTGGVRTGRVRSLGQDCVGIQAV